MPSWSWFEHCSKSLILPLGSRIWSLFVSWNVHQNQNYIKLELAWTLLNQVKLELAWTLLNITPLKIIAGHFCPNSYEKLTKIKN